MKAKKRNWFKRLTDIFFRPKYFFTKIVADGKMEDAMLRAFLWVTKRFSKGLLRIIL